MGDGKKSYKIKIDPVMVVMTPYVMARTAGDFFKMADEYISESNIPLAQYYLYCASIELGMKTAILATDCTPARKEHNKSLGHDLNKVRVSFEKCYPSLWTDEDAKAVESINPFFKNKGLEYFTIDVLEAALKGYKDLPKIEDLRVAADKVNAFLNDNDMFKNAKTTQEPNGGFLNFV